MKGCLWAVGLILICAVVSVVIATAFPSFPAPAKTEQVKVDSLPSVSISNPKDGSYLSENAVTARPSSKEPYEIKQECLILNEDTFISTDVIDNVDDGVGWCRRFNEIVPSTTKAICAEKTRQYRLAAEWIANIPVREDKENKLREAWDACKPEGAK